MKKVLYTFLLSGLLVGNGFAADDCAVECSCTLASCDTVSADAAYTKFSNAVKSPEVDEFIKLLEDKDLLISSLETNLPKFVEGIKVILEKPELKDLKKTYFDLIVDTYSLFASYGKILKTVTKEQSTKLESLYKDVVNAYFELLETSTEEQKAKLKSCSKDLEKLETLYKVFSSLFVQKTTEGHLPVI